MLFVFQDLWEAVESWAELGESEDQAIVKLKEMGNERSASQTKRLNELLRLKYLKTTALRTQERRQSTVAHSESRVSKRNLRIVSVTLQ